MTGVTIEVTLPGVLSNAGLANYFARIDDAITNTFPLMDAIGTVLVEGTQRRFETGTGPDGVAWPKSFRASLDGGLTLVDSGRLVASITHQAEQDAVRVGTNVPYALIHQVGGEITPKSGNALQFKLADGTTVAVGKVTMPARPFLGIDAEDRAGIEEHVELFLEDIVP